MKNTILFILSSVLAVLLVEIGLRVFWTNPYAKSDADQVLKIRIAHKNLNQTFDRQFIDSEVPTVSFRTNHRGYIEPAYRFTEPDFTIAFLGGSTTETSAVDETKRFPYLVSKLLEKEGIMVNSLNAARSGGTVHDSLNILLNHLIVDRPDVVVLMHAANDIGLLKQDDDYSTRMGFSITSSDIAKYSLQIGSTTSWLVGFARDAFTFSGFRQNDNVDYHTQINVIEPYRARLKIFVDMCRAFGITPVLMTQPVAGNIKNKMTPDWIDLDAQGQYNNVVREIGSETGTTIIDLEAFVVESVENGEELSNVFYDGMHVTDYGSTLYAKQIVKSFVRLLGDL